jgi:hypothetical protein
MATFRGNLLPLVLSAVGRVPARLHLATHDHEYLLGLRTRAAAHLG